MTRLYVRSLWHQPWEKFYYSSSKNDEGGIDCEIGLLELDAPMRVRVGQWGGSRAVLVVGSERGQPLCEDVV